VDPQSRPGEFSSSAGSCGATRWGPFAVTARRRCDLARFDVCTFSGRSATTGFLSAVRRTGERCPAGGLVSVGREL